MSNKNPFDFSDLIKQMDPTKLAQQFQEMLSSLPVANLDPSAIAESQRKNFETMMQANQAAVSGAQSLLKRQAEMMQTTLSEGAQAVQSLSDSEPSEMAEKNTELIENAMKKSMDNFTEIAGMIEGIYGEMSEKVEQRLKENLDELRDTLAKTK
ncbi:MAG: phasin family protein [Arenicellales bacterium]